jgi:hypothetical protein
MMTSKQSMVCQLALTYVRGEFRAVEDGKFASWSQLRGARRWGGAHRAGKDTTLQASRRIHNI